MRLDNELLWIVLAVAMFLMIMLQLNSILKEVKKGNKDQQEIKTRLAWVKKRQLARKRSY